MVGWKKLPPSACGFAAGDDARAFRKGVGNMFFDLSYRFIIDQRAGGDPVLQAVADAQLFHRLL